MEDQFYYLKFKAAFEALRNGNRAEKMKAYMKGHFEFYGIDSTQRKEVTADILRNYGKPDPSVLMGLTGLMWADPHREMQYTAMSINDRSLKSLEEFYAFFIDKLIGQKSWWDTVDWLAPKGMGTFFKRFPGLQDQFLGKWMSSGNMWYIRSAILFQLHYKKDTDFDLVKHLILRTTGTKEFFINKASGWILREYSKTNADPVISFIESHPELHPLTKREGLKWLKNKGIIKE
jgi:3-methyladenine DNA glycosylase AlkD